MTQPEKRTGNPAITELAEAAQHQGLVIAGHIGSGKTGLADHLRQRRRFNFV